MATGKEHWFSKFIKNTKLLFAFFMSGGNQHTKLSQVFYNVRLVKVCEKEMRSDFVLFMQNSLCWKLKKLNFPGRYRMLAASKSSFDENKNNLTLPQKLKDKKRETVTFPIPLLLFDKGLRIFDFHWLKRCMEKKKYLKNFIKKWLQKYRIMQSFYLTLTEQFCHGIWVLKKLKGIKWKILSVRISGYFTCRGQASGTSWTIIRPR